MEKNLKHEQYVVSAIVISCVIIIWWQDVETIVISVQDRLLRSHRTMI